MFRAVAKSRTTFRIVSSAAGHLLLLGSIGLFGSPANAQTEVSFSADLADTLAERCSGCHGGNRPRRELRIESYTSLLQGSENGAIVEPNDSDNSLMILKMKGEADGDRMPPNGTALSNETIAKFEQWIDAGAKFDGQDPGLALTRLASASKLKRLSQDELAREAVKLAEKNWSLAFSSDSPTTVSTEHFLFVASKNDATLAETGKLAESAYVKSAKLLGVSDYKLKSPFVVYMVPKRYDFGEFTQMVEERDASSLGTATRYWRPDGGLGYAVLGPASSNANVKKKSSSKKKIPFVSDTELLRLVSALQLNRWGAPVWYAEGLAQLALEKSDRKSRLVAQWKSRAPRALASAKTANDVFDGKLPVVDADAATWALAKYLASDARRMRALHTALASGKSFKSSFGAIYGKSPADVCDAWLARFRTKRK